MITKNSENSYCVSVAIGLFVSIVILSQLSERQLVIASVQDNGM